MIKDQVWILSTQMAMYVWSLGFGARDRQIDPESSLACQPSWNDEMLAQLVILSQEHPSSNSQT